MGTRMVVSAQSGGDHELTTAPLLKLVVHRLWGHLSTFPEPSFPRAHSFSVQERCLFSGGQGWGGW